MPGVGRGHIGRVGIIAAATLMAAGCDFGQMFGPGGSGLADVTDDVAAPVLPCEAVACLEWGETLGDQDPDGTGAGARQCGAGFHRALYILPIQPGASLSVVVNPSSSVNVELYALAACYEDAFGGECHDEEWSGDAETLEVSGDDFPGVDYILIGVEEVGFSGTYSIAVVDHNGGDVTPTVGSEVCP